MKGKKSELRIEYKCRIPGADYPGGIQPGKSFNCCLQEYLSRRMEGGMR